ncbi:MAG: maleylacetoacetate isomerase [Proteobacteria bacterium]|nr:MAG: maleylacetoacetate isomerase [Pseudomonadota bacterium]
MPPITLFHYWRSGASWRVRWGLELKGVAHEKVAVNILAGEEKLPGYLAKNPAGYVPALSVEGHPPLGESLAILEWLEENYPRPSFFSGDSFQRALIRQLAETLNAGTQPIQNLDVARLHSEDKAEQARWMHHWMSRGLGVFESLLKRADPGHGKFAFGNEPSLADLCLIPQVYSAHRLNVDMDQFPRCRDIYAHALTQPSCQASHPDRFAPAT